MRSPRAVFTAMVLAILGLLAVVAPSASAITGGEPDGNRHPNVGLILFYTEDGRFRCSATLISPTVLLTAAHCTEGVLGSTLVTFDSVIAEEPPSGFPVAADPTEGYTDEEIEAAGYLSGTAYTHPEYSGFTDLANWNDVGVIVLDEPVTDIEPAVAGAGGLPRPVTRSRRCRARSSRSSATAPRCASRRPARRSRSR